MRPEKTAMTHSGFKVGLAAILEQWMNEPCAAKNLGITTSASLC